MVIDTVRSILTRWTSEHPLENRGFADEEMSVNFEKLVFNLQIEGKRSTISESLFAKESLTPTKKTDISSSR